MAHPKSNADEVLRQFRWYFPVVHWPLDGLRPVRGFGRDAYRITGDCQAGQPDVILSWKFRCKFYLSNYQWITAYFYYYGVTWIDAEPDTNQKHSSLITFSPKHQSISGLGGDECFLTHHHSHRCLNVYALCRLPFQLYFLLLQVLKQSLQDL